MILFGKEITQTSPPLFVAELSCNHNGSLEQAKELMQAAKEAGADAAKIQCYYAEEMTLAPSDFGSNADINFQQNIEDGPWKNRNLYDLYSKTQTVHEWIEPLFDYAEELNIPLFSSVFGSDGLQRLEYNDCPAYKIASFENNDLELITSVMKTTKPLLISTGMASYEEVARLADLVDRNNTCLMHCVSKYPHDLSEVNLFKINFLKGFYPIIAGYSDHCINYEAMQIAIGLGAKIIEKHFTISRHTEDSDFSLTSAEFEDYKTDGLCAWEAMRSKPHAEDSSRQFRRSLYVVKNISKGEFFTNENIKSIRPSYGLEPYKYKNILGKKASKDLEAGTAMKEEYLSND